MNPVKNKPVPVQRMVSGASHAANPDRRRLMAWLREWELDRLLPHDAPPADQPDRSARHRPVLSYVAAPIPTPLFAGEIRLLPPLSGDTATMRRPAYVALLQPLDGARWQVAPFGRFAAPAVPGEWATGRKSLHLRVLCVWNAGPLAASLLHAGWRAGRLTAAERHAVTVLQAAQTGAPLPLAVARRVGPPLVHPLDPRYDYLDEERRLWLDLPSTADTAPAWTDGELARAAEKKAPYGTDLRRKWVRSGRAVK